MTQSSPLPDDGADLRPLVERLTGRPVTALVRGGQGGNNRLYRAETADGPLAVKCYFHHRDDRRDRLVAEFAALRFLGEHDIRAVPHAVAADAAAGVAVYGWLEGETVETRRPGDMERLAEFIGSLKALTASPDAAALPLASEACLSAAELAAQLGRRLARLDLGARDAHADVAAFFDDDLTPAVVAAVTTAREAYGRRGWDFTAELAVDQQILSPSDFGTHNALRRPDGSLAFLDFEYFGWDDPVKLVADTLLHPGMMLDEAERAQFRRAALAIHGDEAGFAERLDILLPLYALRWALIVLNPFLPERWARMSFATGAERARVLEAQLVKARHFVAHGLLSG
jgi:hypothetical protein